MVAFLVMQKLRGILDRSTLLQETNYGPYISFVLEDTSGVCFFPCPETWETSETTDVKRRDFFFFS